MFTGIVEEIGTVRRAAAGHLSIGAQRVLEGTQVGDSIAVNGVCLTVTTLDAAGFEADVMPETLRRSSLGALRPGSRVNLERALTLSARLGGHIVSGHIDGTGRVAALREEKNARVMTIEAPPALTRYIVVKGSVALDGVSLTVAAETPGGFSVSLIPHTRGVTTLDEKNAGDTVNIETDIIGKYVEKLLGAAPAEEAGSGGLSRAFLARHGF
ncbi:MAG: riboflavin synthase [Schwartzia sp.]|nr:riboflavin synthase [Schwartzia sp. (in: firmicutes)]